MVSSVEGDSDSSSALDTRSQGYHSPAADTMSKVDASEPGSGDLEFDSAASHSIGPIGPSAEESSRDGVSFAQGRPRADSGGKAPPPPRPRKPLSPSRGGGGGGPEGKSGSFESFEGHARQRMPVGDASGEEEEAVRRRSRGRRRSNTLDGDGAASTGSSLLHSPQLPPASRRMQTAPDNNGGGAAGQGLLSHSSAGPQGRFGTSSTRSRQPFSGTPRRPSWSAPSTARALTTAPSLMSMSSQGHRPSRRIDTACRYLVACGLDDSLALEELAQLFLK